MGDFLIDAMGWVSNILIGETSFEIHIWLLKNIFVCSLSLFHNFVDDAVCQIAAWRSVKSHKKFQWQDLLTGYKFDRFFWSGLAALLHMTKNVLHSGPSMYVGNWSWSRVLVKKEKSAKKGTGSSAMNILGHHRYGNKSGKSLLPSSLFGGRPCCNLPKLWWYTSSLLFFLNNSNPSSRIRVGQKLWVWFE